MTSQIAMIKIADDRDFTDGLCDCCMKPSGRFHLCADCDKIWIWTDFHNAYIHKTDLFSEMKREYDNWIATTEKGRRLAQKAGEIMEQVSGTMAKFQACPTIGATPTTKGVRKEYLPDCLDASVKVKIEPIGLNNMCFHNSEWVEQTFGFKQVFGLNIVGCKCGGRLNFEIHALNRYGDRSLFDITRDFCGETEKWFYQFGNADFDNHYYKAIFGEKMLCFEPSCRCCGKKQSWNNSAFVWTDNESKFEKCLKVIEDFDESLVEAY